jgi:hypothetical protein
MSCGLGKSARSLGVHAAERSVAFLADVRRIPCRDMNNPVDAANGSVEQPLIRDVAHPTRGRRRCRVKSAAAAASSPTTVCERVSRTQIARPTRPLAQ